MDEKLSVKPATQITAVGRGGNYHRETKLLYYPATKPAG